MGIWRRRGCLEGRRLLWACLVLQCLGWSLFCACVYGGSVYTGMLAQLGVSCLGQNASRISILAATGVGCLTVRALERRGLSVVQTTVLMVCYACLIVLWVVTAITSPDGGMLIVFGVAAGALASVPLLAWFDGFLGLYAMAGPLWCIMAIAVGNATWPLISLMTGEFVHGVPLALGLLVVGSAMGALFQGRLLGLNVAGAISKPEKTDPKENAYRLTLYAFMVVLSFGISWGVSWGVVSLGSVPGGAAAPEWVITVGGLAGSLLVGLYVLMARRFDSLRFGLFIRLLLAFSGSVCVCVPCASVLVPAAIPALCRAVVVVQGVAMTFFSVEICYEKRLGITEVMPLNYIVFVVSGCLAMTLPMMLDACGVTGLFCWSVLSAVSVTATIFVIPALPSSRSTAATFTFSELPENESYEARALHAVVSLANKYDLSGRETEVLELLVQGKTRTEIAERLALSSWTVKDHLTSIYRKVGVHSAKELMVLAADGETAGRG